jgi:hypothetical protein
MVLRPTNLTEVENRRWEVDFGGAHFFVFLGRVFAVHPGLAK